MLSNILVLLSGTLCLFALEMLPAVDAFKSGLKVYFFSLNESD